MGLVKWAQQMTVQAAVGLASLVGPSIPSYEPPRLTRRTRIARMSAAATVVLSASVAMVTATVTAVVTDLVEARRRRTERHEDRLDEILSRYRDPLAYAAYELQSRLYNIAEQRFLENNLENDRLDGYAIDSTLWLLAQYFGWTEIIRQEVEFLDLGDIEENLKLRRLVAQITDVFATEPGGPLRILRAEQRGIGELMIASGSEVTRHRPVGYASFRQLLRASDVPWFPRLAEDIRNWHDSAAGCTRTIWVQQALIDLLDHLDQDRSRFPAHGRTKLGGPSTDHADARPSAPSAP